MNIYISEQEAKNLESSQILSIRVGSHLYNLNNSQSDEDILCIYATKEEDLHSLIHIHHQFQYKTQNTDYLFCSLQVFIQNIMSGDSTLNFEALYSEELRNNKELSWLYKIKDSFISYSLIRAYLGFARRDIKQFKKEKNHKKLFHAFRGLKIAQRMMKDKTYSNDFKTLGADTFTTLEEIKNGDTKDYLFADSILTEITTTREELNKLLEAKQIERGISLSTLKSLDEAVKISSKKLMTQGQSYNDTVLKSYLETDLDPNKLL